MLLHLIDRVVIMFGVVREKSQYKIVAVVCHQIVVQVRRRFLTSGFGQHQKRSAGFRFQVFAIGERKGHRIVDDGVGDNVFHRTGKLVLHRGFTEDCRFDLRSAHLFDSLRKRQVADRQVAGLAHERVISCQAHDQARRPRADLRIQLRTFSIQYQHPI